MPAGPAPLIPCPTLPLAARAYWAVAPGRGECRAEPEIRTLPAGHALVETWYSGVSPGTESLVGRGEVPPECWGPMACWGMAGSFALPIKYGYCCVGRVLAAGAMGGAAAGEALTGRLVYTMHPHQDRFVAPVGRLLPLPVGLPPRRGALVPAFETALNAIWDAAPGLPTPLRSPADTEPDTQPRGRIAVVGGGLIGLAIACLLPRLGYGPALVVERSAARRQRIAALAARGLPLLAVAPREAEPGGFDCVFHTSATGAGLSLALSLLGFEGQVVELSWYGRRRVRLALGGGFHYRRQRLLSSQVSAIAAPRRGQVDHRGRLAEVLRLLAGPEYDALLAPWISFDNLPAYLAALCAGARPAFAQPVRYPAAQDEVDLDL